MTKQEFQTKAQVMIADLMATANNGVLTILGKTYTVEKVTKYTVEVTGAKGAKHIVSTSPKSQVFQDRECGVYFIGKTDFTFFDGHTVRLQKI